MRAIDEDCAEEVIPFHFGRALVNRTLSSVPDLNYLLVDRELESATARELAHESERIQAPTGTSFRRINVDEQAAADRLLPEFTRLEFRPERFSVMVRHRDPDHAAGRTDVRQVDWATYEAVRRRAIASWAPTPLIAAQVLAKQRLAGGVVPTTYWCAFVEGDAGSCCELRRQGTAAQIEFVETLVPYRRRGLARQLLSEVLQSVHSSDFVFLVTDLLDWPQHFYSRMGFERVGIESRFMRDLGG